MTARRCLDCPAILIDPPRGGRPPVRCPACHGRHVREAARILKRTRRQAMSRKEKP